jgi:hypothetical protein
MKTLRQMESEASKLYSQLEIGSFFDTYHDLMYDLVYQFDYLEDDCDYDYKIATELLEKCRAIIKAQQILLKVKIK